MRKKKQQETQKVIPVVPFKKVKKISFEQYIARRPNIKAQHIAGMKAFVKNVEKLRTEEIWDVVFSSY